MKVSFLPRTIRDNAARRRWRRMLRSPFGNGGEALLALTPRDLRQLGVMLPLRRRIRFGGRVGPRWLDWRAQRERRLADRAPVAEPT